MELQNTTINLPSYIFRVVVNFWQLYQQGKVKSVSMFHFLETDIREQEKYEMRTQASVDNTVNDLRYEFKYDNCMKDKNNLFIK